MEATMWGGAITRPQLQQTISHLRKLDELPEVPCENLAAPEVDQTRHLSISREKEIASNLAFLSATSDESLRSWLSALKNTATGKESRFG